MPISLHKVWNSCVVGDDVVWNSKAENDGFDEVHGSHGGRAGDGDCFNPLGKLVDHHEEVGATAFGGFLQRAHHVKSPSCEGPCQRYCLEL